MAIYAIASTSGAPGVTTAALAMTLQWPRPVLLVEADPAGGSAILAGHFRGAVEHDRGLLHLAAAHRTGDLDDTLWSQTFALAEQRFLLPAVTDAAQAPSLRPLWTPLAAALTRVSDAGTDVVIDAGRLGHAAEPAPLLRAADCVLLASRTHLPAVNAVRARVSALRDDLGHPSDGPLGLLLIGPGRPHSGAGITAATGLPVTATLAWDPVSAATYSAGAERGRRFERAPLPASAARAITELTTATQRAADALNPYAAATPPQPPTTDARERSHA